MSVMEVIYMYVTMFFLAIIAVLVVIGSLIQFFTGEDRTEEKNTQKEKDFTIEHEYWELTRVPKENPNPYADTPLFPEYELKNVKKKRIL